MCCGSSIFCWLGKQEFRDSLLLRCVTRKFRLKKRQLVTQFVSHFQSSWWCWHKGCLERVTVAQTQARKWICSSGCSWSRDLNAKPEVSRNGGVDSVPLKLKMIVFPETERWNNKESIQQTAFVPVLNLQDWPACRSCDWICGVFCCAHQQALNLGAPKFLHSLANLGISLLDEVAIFVLF